MAYAIRRSVDECGRDLYRQGERILGWLEAAHARVGRTCPLKMPLPPRTSSGMCLQWS